MQAIHEAQIIPLELASSAARAPQPEYLPPNRIATDKAIQEAIAVALRCSLLLSVEDLLPVLRRFVTEPLTEEALRRSLKAHRVSRFIDFVPYEIRPFLAGQQDRAAGVFLLQVLKLVPPGPQAKPKYLYIALELRSRWCFIQAHASRSTRTARHFIRALAAKAPLRVNKVFSRSESAGRLAQEGNPSFHKALQLNCRNKGIDYQTVSLPTVVEEELAWAEGLGLHDLVQGLGKTRKADAQVLIDRFAEAYNSEMTLRALGGRTPDEALRLPSLSDDDSARARRVKQTPINARPAVAAPPVQEEGATNKPAAARVFELSPHSAVTVAMDKAAANEAYAGGVLPPRHLVRPAISITALMMALALGGWSAYRHLESDRAAERPPMTATAPTSSVVVQQPAKPTPVETTAPGTYTQEEVAQEPVIEQPEAQESAGQESLTQEGVPQEAKWTDKRQTHSWKVRMAVPSWQSEAMRATEKWRSYSWKLAITEPGMDPKADNAPLKTRPEQWQFVIAPSSGELEQIKKTAQQVLPVAQPEAVADGPAVAEVQAPAEERTTVQGEAELAALPAESRETPRPLINKIEKTPVSITPGDKAAQRYREALELLGHGLVAEAEAKLWLALAQDQSHIESRTLAIRLMIEQGRLTKAQELLRQGIDVAPEHYAFVQSLAHILASQGRQQEALDYMERARGLAEEDANYMALLAWLYQGNNRHAEAAATYVDLLAKHPAQAKWWLGLAISLEAQRDWVGARDAYNYAMAAGLEDGLNQYALRRLERIRSQ